MKTDLYGQKLRLRDNIFGKYVAYRCPVINIATVLAYLKYFLYNLCTNSKFQPSNILEYVALLFSIILVYKLCAIIFSTNPEHFTAVCPIEQEK